ncbi:MAG TPA: translation initiation factor IF-2 subunit alpha [Candidatus Thermoplasmatota archaeon]|nr:translation initiation factor IF-2 subunit alpha [Candidatus Thermoplasmatota archaeon]
MVKKSKFPEEGELVVGTVKDVKGFGAFVNLDEYPGREGFIHIAEVAAGWVKYVRDHVRENQKVVCKVVQVDQGRGHVDLSLKRVNDHQRREKINEWKNEQKADKLFEIVAQRASVPVEQAWEKYGFSLAEKFGSMYRAFEAAAMNEDMLVEEGFEGPWTTHYMEVARENIAIPFVVIKGFVQLETPNPDGIEDLKAALEKAGESEFEDVEIAIQYVGAPRYRIRVKAPDYKVAEEQLREAADRAIKIIAKRGGKGEFQRGEAEA